MLRRFPPTLSGSLVAAFLVATVACLQAGAVQTPKGAPVPDWMASCPGVAGTAATPPPAPEPAPPTQPVEPQSYVVGRGDGLAIQMSPDVFLLETERCSRSDYKVGDDGKINFCQLQQISVENKTVREIEAMIRQEFINRKIYDNPQVTVTVVDFRSQTVFVNGEVRTAGEQLIKGSDMTLMHAIAAAGGFGPNAGPDVYILRPRRTGEGATPMQVMNPDDPNVEKLRYPRKALMGGGGSTASFLDPPVQAGDTIWVTTAQMYYINGEVRSTGPKVWEPCMTVGDAIATAGGLTDKGSLGRSKIQRRDEATGKFFDVKNLKLETYLYPKDTLTIGKKLF